MQLRCYNLRVVMAQITHTHGMRDYSMKCFNSLMFWFDWLLEVIHGYVWLHPGGNIIVSVQGEIYMTCNNLKS